MLLNDPRPLHYGYSNVIAGPSQLVIDIHKAEIEQCVLARESVTSVYASVYASVCVCLDVLRSPHTVPIIGQISSQDVCFFS